MQMESERLALSLLDIGHQQLRIFQQQSRLISRVDGEYGTLFDSLLQRSGSPPDHPSCPDPWPIHPLHQHLNLPSIAACLASCGHFVEPSTVALLNRRYGADLVDRAQFTASWQISQRFSPTSASVSVSLFPSDITLSNDIVSVLMSEIQLELDLRAAFLQFPRAFQVLDRASVGSISSADFIAAMKTILPSEYGMENALQAAFFVLDSDQDNVFTIGQPIQLSSPPVVDPRIVSDITTIYSFFGRFVKFHSLVSLSGLQASDESNSLDLEFELELDNLRTLQAEAVTSQIKTQFQFQASSSRVAQFVSSSLLESSVLLPQYLDRLSCVPLLSVSSANSLSHAITAYFTVQIMLDSAAEIVMRLLLSQETQFSLSGLFNSIMSTSGHFTATASSVASCQHIVEYFHRHNMPCLPEEISIFVRRALMRCSMDSSDSNGLPFSAFTAAFVIADQEAVCTLRQREIMFSSTPRHVDDGVCAINAFHELVAIAVFRERARQALVRNANFSISDAFNLFCPAYCGCIQPADLAAFYQKHGNCVSAHDVELLLARFESNQQSGISYQNFVRELLPLHP